MFENIDALYANLRSLKPLRSSTLARIQEDFIIRYTYNTNAIEGSTLTEHDTYLLLKEDVTASGKPLRYHLDAVGHRDAFLYIQALAQENAPLTEELVKAVHDRVLMRDAESPKGRYRDVDVYISGADVILPSAEQVPSRMQSLLHAYQAQMQEWHIVKRIALFHMQFECVHPFIDGNGRTGRLLMNYELLRNGYPPIDIKFKDRKRYYYCLQAYEGPDEDELPMLYMVAEYLEDALRDRIHITEQDQGLNNSKSDRDTEHDR